MAAKCRGCGAVIVWIKTPAGKPMPCDPEPVLYWIHTRGKARERIVTPKGGVISCSLTGETGTATGLGYIPHWATCPERDQFKKGAKTRD